MWESSFFQYWRQLESRGNLYGSQRRGIFRRSSKFLSKSRNCCFFLILWPQSTITELRWKKTNKMLVCQLCPKNFLDHDMYTGICLIRLNINCFILLSYLIKIKWKVYNKKITLNCSSFKNTLKSQLGKWVFLQENWSSILKQHSERRQSIDTKIDTKILNIPSLFSVANNNL